MSYASQTLELSPGPGKRWRATLLDFSPAAKMMAERHGWLPTASPVSQTDSRGVCPLSKDALSPGAEL
jgi:hypothetical protein